MNCRAVIASQAGLFWAVASGGGGGARGRRVHSDEATSRGYIWHFSLILWIWPLRVLLRISEAFRFHVASVSNGFIMDLMFFVTHEQGTE